MNRLKSTEIKSTRERLLKEQQGLCALCKEAIAPGEAVLDHCHSTGQLRSVLHRGCNAYIGALENNQKRNRISSTRLQQILLNFMQYVQTLKPILHSTHRTPEEKKLRAKKRAKQRKAK